MLTVMAVWAVRAQIRHKVEVLQMVTTFDLSFDGTKFAVPKERLVPFVNRNPDSPRKAS
jgi:hypothetical protein